MSLILIPILLLVLNFWPLMMCLHYKTGALSTISTLVLCALGIGSFGALSFIAFLIAAISVGLYNTVKSTMVFCALVVLGSAFGIAELSFWLNSIGAV